MNRLRFLSVDPTTGRINFNLSRYGGLTVRRIFAYPATILAVVGALLVGTTVSANALTGYPTNFVVSHGSVINDGGQNVMQLNVVNPTRSAYSDYFKSSLGGSWQGRTVVVCITAKPSNGNQTHVTASWWASGGSAWLVFNGGSYTRNCFLTYNNVSSNMGNYQVSLYVITSQARVRSVEIYPA